MKIRIKKLALFITLILGINCAILEAYYGQSYGYPYSYGLGGYGYPGSIFYPYSNSYSNYYDS